MTWFLRSIDDTSFDRWLASIASSPLWQSTMGGIMFLRRYLRTCGAAHNNNEVEEQEEPITVSETLAEAEAKLARVDAELAAMDAEAAAAAGVSAAAATAGDLQEEPLTVIAVSSCRGWGCQ